MQSSDTPSARRNLLPAFQPQFLLLFSFILILLSGLAPTTLAQNTAVQVYADNRLQTIDGFGAHQGNNQTSAQWWQQLYYDDLGASIYRVDLTPKLISPYSDLSYYSPWFMGSGTDHVFNLEDPDNPNGPEGNRVRTYTGPQDYPRLFGGERAPIAVMGPDIEANLSYFTYPNDGAIAAGLSRKTALGDFKLIGSLWSPVPWVKVSSGNTYNQNWWPGPVAGTPWPFVWGGNFAGGRLDVSGTPLAEFDDAALGGAGPTSALTQFARSTAAYILGFQRRYGVQFYGISIQNELNFEQFYNSATYPLSSQYLTALKAIRAEFDQHDELRDIRLMGPEDLLGGDAYGLWEYGGPVHKNLQYLRNIANDPAAAAALDFFCIHGYASDGVSSAGANPATWDWWTNGWQASPAPGIPPNVQGFAAFGKKSWMTETSGENPAWLWPASGFPGNGAWSIALKIHQALTTGRESAWLYWTFSESDNSGNVTEFALTNQTAGAAAPKYVAAKHFFKYIRPGAQRVLTSASGGGNLQASAYVHDQNGTLTLILINTSPSLQTADLQLETSGLLPTAFDAYTSEKDEYWQSGVIPVTDGNKLAVTVPGYGVVTLYGAGFTSNIKEPDAPISAGFLGIEPNPSQQDVRVRYRLDQPGQVRLSVADGQGRTVAVLTDKKQPAGDYSIVFSAGNLPPGTYFCTLETAGKVWTKKVKIIR